MKFDGNIYACVSGDQLLVSMSTAGWRRCRYHEAYDTLYVRIWEFGPLLVEHTRTLP